MFLLVRFSFNLCMVNRIGKGGGSGVEPVQEKQEWIKCPFATLSLIPICGCHLQIGTVTPTVPSMGAATLCSKFSAF